MAGSTSDQPLLVIYRAFQSCTNIRYWVAGFASRLLVEYLSLLFACGPALFFYGMPLSCRGISQEESEISKVEIRNPSIPEGLKILCQGILLCRPV